MRDLQTVNGESFRVNDATCEGFKFVQLGSALRECRIMIHIRSGYDALHAGRREMADRHIAEGEQHIVRQEELVTRLRTQSLPTEEAEKLLAIFHSTMIEHRTHRAAIMEALRAENL